MGTKSEVLGLTYIFITQTACILSQKCHMGLRSTRHTHRVIDLKKKNFLIDRDYQAGRMSRTTFSTTSLGGDLRKFGWMIHQENVSRLGQSSSASFFTTSQDHVLSTRPEIPVAVADCRDGAGDGDLRRKKADKP